MHSGYGYGDVIADEGDEGGKLDELLFPIAALTILGAGTTAVLLSPLWAPIVSPAITGIITALGRKKREAVEDPVALKAIEETETLENFWMRSPGAKDQAEKLLASYLDCSGLALPGASNQCLERLACINSRPETEKIPAQEKKVLSM